MKILNDIEQKIEDEILRAAARCRSAHGSIWRAALSIWRLWGKYERHALREIARHAAMDISSLENWAHAYDFFAGALKLRNCSEVRRLRRLLTPSHFWNAWALMRKYGLSQDEMIAYLQEMIVRRANGEPHGAQALRMEVEAHEAQRDNVPGWDYYKPRVKALCIRLLASNAPQDIVQAARLMLNYIEGEE